MVISQDATDEPNQGFTDFSELKNGVGRSPASVKAINAKALAEGYTKGLFIA